MLVSSEDFNSSPELQRRFLTKLWRSVNEPCRCNRCQRSAGDRLPVRLPVGVDVGVALVGLGEVEALFPIE